MIRSIRQSIAARRRRKQLESNDPTAAKVRSLMPKCLVCGEVPEGHRYAEIASMPCTEEDKGSVIALFHHVDNHEWEALKGFRKFRGDQDDAIAFAITGPHEGGVVILLRDPADLYSRVEIYLEETITAEEVSKINNLVTQEKWKEL